MLPVVGRSGNQGEGDSPPDSPYSSGMTAYDEGRPGEGTYMKHLRYSSTHAMTRLLMLTSSCLILLHRIESQDVGACPGPQSLYRAVKGGVENSEGGRQAAKEGACVEAGTRPGRPIDGVFEQQGQSEGSTIKPRLPLAPPRAATAATVRGAERYGEGRRGSDSEREKII